MYNRIALSAVPPLCRITRSCHWLSARRAIGPSGSTLAHALPNLYVATDDEDMNEEPQFVSAVVDGYVNHHGCPVTAVFTWVPTSPYEVNVLFFQGTDGATSEWTFGRALLTAAFGAPGVVGDGDVLVYYDRNGNTIVMRLSGIEGAADIMFGANEIGLFLGETDAIVPTGNESMADELDVELAQLLGS